MQHRGIVTEIHRQQPFGWISPLGGGADIFFHLKTLSLGETFPAVGDPVTFKISADPKGRRCAVDVRRENRVGIEAEKHSQKSETKEGDPVRFGDQVDAD